MLFVKCGQCGSINRFVSNSEEYPVCAKCSTRLDTSRSTSDRPISVSDATFFDEVLHTAVPVLVDFYAPWCGACRSVEPALEAIASRHKGKLKVTTLDVDRNPRSASKYQIRATPTLIVFQNGQIVEQFVGAAPERQLLDVVQKYII